jgi:hypothetical protein
MAPPLKNRNFIFPVSVIIISCLIFFAKGIFFDQRAITTDTSDEFFPTMWYTGELWRNGFLPLWNPFLFNGYPMFADPQNQTFYPVNLLISFVAHFSAKVVYLQLVLHFILAGIFMYLFSGFYVRNTTGRLVAAFVYMFSGFMINHCGHLTMLNSVVWLPLILFFLEKGWREHSLSYFFPAGLSIASLVFAGHPQSALFIGYIVFFFAVFRSLWPADEKRFSFFPLKLTVISFLFGVLLGAVQLVPSYEFSTMANRSGPLPYVLAVLASGKFHPAHLATLFLPDYFGGAKGPYTGLTDISHSSIYCGVIFLFVLPFLFIRKGREIYFFLFMGVMTILISLGSYGVIFRAIYQYLPGFDLFRSPVQYRFGLTFFAAILTGMGLDNVLEKGGRSSLQKRACRAYGAGIIILVMVFVLIRFFKPIGEHVSSNVLFGAFFFYALYFLFSAALILREKGKLSLYFFQAVILVLAFSDFYISGADALTAGRRMRHDELERAPGVVEAIKGSGSGNVREGLKNPFVSPQEIERGLYRIYVDDDPNARFRRLPYIPYSYFKLGPLLGFDRAMLHKVFLVDGYNPMMLKRYVFFNGILRYRDYPKFLMLSNVKYIIEPDGKVQILPEAATLPRSYLVTSAEYVRTSSAIIDKLADPSFDLRQKAVVEEPLELTHDAASGEKGKTKIMEYLPAKIVITTESERPALLVLSDSYYPGWKTSVDSGTVAEALQVNYCFMGARVPSGRHTVTFEFRPRSIRLGIAVSAATLFLGIFVFLRGVKKRRKNHAPQVI